MPREENLTKREQYTSVYDGGRTWVSTLLVMKALPNGLASSRYGLSVSKQVGMAVVRNRIKRRLREIIRLTPLKPGWDIVFIARKPAADASYTELRKTAEGLLSRARLLMGKNERNTYQPNTSRGLS